jgi:4-hydroxy-3-polyprenylbenzoate decarboxylase
MVDHSLGRVLDLFGLDAGTALRWGEPTKKQHHPDSSGTGQLSSRSIT